MGITIVESPSEAGSNRRRRVSCADPLISGSAIALSAAPSKPTGRGPAPRELDADRGGTGDFGGVSFAVAELDPAAPDAAAEVAETTGNTSVMDSIAARRCTPAEGSEAGADAPLRATASDPARTADRRIIQSMRSTAAAATLTPTDTHAQSTVPVRSATTSRPNAIRTRISTSSNTIHSACGGAATSRPHRPSRSRGQLPASARWPYPVAAYPPPLEFDRPSDGAADPRSPRSLSWDSR
jgi:hypothetical protein